MMGDEGEYWRGVESARKRIRAEQGVECPRCKEQQPKRHPTVLLPGQKCRVDGYRDPRKRGQQPLTGDEKGRVSQLAYKSKQGGQITPDEQQFLESMFRKNPAEYGEVQRAASRAAEADYKAMFSA